MPPTGTFDPVRYKADTRAEWREAADGWRAWPACSRPPTPARP